MAVLHWLRFFISLLIFQIGICVENPTVKETIRDFTNIANGLEGASLHLYFGMSKTLDLPNLSELSLPVTLTHRQDLIPFQNFPDLRVWVSHNNKRELVRSAYFILMTSFPRTNCAEFIQYFPRTVPYRSLHDFIVLYVDTGFLAGCEYDFFTGWVSPNNMRDLNHFLNLLLLPVFDADKVYTKAQSQVVPIPCSRNKGLVECFFSFLSIVTCNGRCWVFDIPWDHPKIQKWEHISMGEVLTNYSRNGFWNGNFSEGGDWAEVIYKSLSTYTRISDVVSRAPKASFHRERITRQLSDVMSDLCVDALDIWIPKNFDMNLTKHPHRKPTVQRVLHASTSISIQSVTWSGNHYDLNEQYEFIQYATNSMTFTTCDGVKKLTSLEFYLNPYDLLSWMSFLLLTVIAIPGFFFLYYKVGQRDHSSKHS